MVVVNESGLYSLILTSRKEAARRFKKWVTAEVLPQIRKTGCYGAPAMDVRDPAQLSRIALQLIDIEVNRELTEQAELAEGKVATLLPVAQAYRSSIQQPRRSRSGHF